ncbi:MAG: BrnT family toxin [Terriglobia bacterium]
MTKLLAARSIINLDFEWDDIKAAENVRSHGVSFAHAALAFRDPFAVEWIDLREDYGEERIILLGMTDDHILTVVYTERAERVRIISARPATKNEQDLYYRQNAQ